MRVTNLLLGLALSGVVHALVLLPGSGESARPEASEAPSSVPAPRIVVTASADEAALTPPEESTAEPEVLPVPPVEPEPEPAPEPEPEPRPPVVAPPDPEPVAEPVVDAEQPVAPVLETIDEQQLSEPPLELAQEHEGAVADDVESGPGPGPRAGEARPRPELVLSWDGPEHLLAVARREGFRVVAVGASGKIAGEVREGESTLAAFRSRVGLFSNRVRALPRGFFPDLVLGDEAVREFWVLVPVAADRRLTTRTDEAAEDEGLSPESVRAVHARYAPNGRGGYDLRIRSVEHR